MELDSELFSASLLFCLVALYIVVALYALRLGSVLPGRGSCTSLLGAIVALIVLWHIRGQLQPGLSFHLLGVTAII